MVNYNVNALAYDQVRILAPSEKFYQFMLEMKVISEESFEYLQETIKEDMPEWTATMERYDNPDIEDPEEIWR